MAIFMAIFFGYGYYVCFGYSLWLWLFCISLAIMYACVNSIRLWLFCIAINIIYEFMVMAIMYGYSYYVLLLAILYGHDILWYLVVL